MLHPSRQPGQPPDPSRNRRVQPHRVMRSRCGATGRRLISPRGIAGRALRGSPGPPW
jgi:hypothetical protein